MSRVSPPAIQLSEHPYDRCPGRLGGVEQTRSRGPLRMRDPDGHLILVGQASRVSSNSPLPAFLHASWSVRSADDPAARSDIVSRARASIARDAVRILGGPLRDDLRACHGPGCVLFFVKDHPRREWCSTRMRKPRTRLTPLPPTPPPVAADRRRQRLTSACQTPHQHNVAGQVDTATRQNAPLGR